MIDPKQLVMALPMRRASSTAWLVKNPVMFVVESAPS